MIVKFVFLLQKLKFNNYNAIRTSKLETNERPIFSSLKNSVNSAQRLSNLYLGWSAEMSSRKEKLTGSFLSSL